MFYFLIFIIAIFLSFVAEKYRHKNEVIVVLFLGSTLLLLASVAGFRDVTVGTDTGDYPLYTYLGVRNTKSISDALLNVTSSIEPLYVILAYYCRNWLNVEFNGFLFVCHLVMYSCFWIGAYRMKIAPLWAFGFLFLFLIYNASLNLNRQYISLGISFLATSFLIEKRLVLFLLLSVIAFFFHKTALFSLLLIPILYIDKRKYNWIVIAISGAVYILFFLMIDYISAIDVFSKYYRYADGTFKSFFSISEFVIRIAFITSFLLLRKGRKDLFSFNVLTIFICEFIVNLLQLKSRFAGRAALSFFMMYLVYIPYYVLYKEKSHRYVTVSLSLLVVLYWWYVYIFGDAGHTAHYSSSILGI